MRAVTQVTLSGLRHVRSGKVREIFDLEDSYLMVATDRVSAFDVVLPNGIPDKGKVLNQLSAYWFQRLQSIVPNHILTVDDREIAVRLGSDYDREQLAGRSMIVRKCEPIPLECVARGFIAGSLFKEYVAAGGETRAVNLHGVDLPAQLRNCERLPEVIFTPATKAAEGHDENISFEQACSIAGEDTASLLREITLNLFKSASKVCEQADILLADTKFEFGVAEGATYLIDEALTPDSSRYWPKATYSAGKPQESLDKQFVRDYLEKLDWNKAAPGPMLPESIVSETRSRYVEIFRRITKRDPIV